MGKRNEYRFSIQLDETDESHRAAAAYLNSLGRKKGRVIAKALLAYMKSDQKPVEAVGSISNTEPEHEKPIHEEIERGKSERMLTLDMGEYGFDQAELDLMRRNYRKFGNLD